MPTPAADALELLVDALAAYRLTRLATADAISEPARRRLVDRTMASAGTEVQAPATAHDPSAQEIVDAQPHPPALARLVTCRWCAGVWIAGGVVAARRVAPSAWDPLARAMALSAVAVLVAGAEDA